MIANNEILHGEDLEVTVQLALAVALAGHAQAVIEQIDKVQEYSAARSWAEARRAVEAALHTVEQTGGKGGQR